MECRRLRAARLFAKKIKHAEIARRLKVSRVSVHHWHKRWKRSGRKGLRATGRLGRKTRITMKQIACVQETLLKGPKTQGYVTEIWTVDRIAAVIRKETGISYHPGHVWKILKRMGWTCQKPETRAKERDERAIKYWVKHTWPEIKKKPSEQAAG